MELHWLPIQEAWDESLRALTQSAKTGGGEADWPSLTRLAAAQLDFRTTGMLDRALQQSVSGMLPFALPTKSVRLAMLSSSTVDHLLPGIRVGGLRRDLWITTYTHDYGQYMQELSNSTSDLYRFAPNVVWFALDGWHLLGEVDATISAGGAARAVDAAIERCVFLWRRAKSAFACHIIQQTPLPVFPALMGHNEHRLPGSKKALLARITQRLREVSAEHDVDLIDTDMLVAKDGLDAWHDSRFWFKAKHEIRASAGPMYGDHVARLLAAQHGRSFKCLVLDLDNTLWGGVIGDDGLDGVVLGQGSPAGEAFVALQRYVWNLSQRGVILAVCSKNDEANAFLPFDRHPEMVLKRSDIACFVANWSDKASNIREIARRLNIGVDSLVFLDDNPFERNIVRRELPMVAVPELPEDPSGYVRCLAAAGYFEITTLTAEDLERSNQYQTNAQRDQIRASAIDLEGYLNELDMVLNWRPFDAIGRQRIVQLISKTNQFNLTTRRYSDTDVDLTMDDPRCMTLQVRLLDRFGDNGIISIIIGRMVETALQIETWLMSCRVLGRKVEVACLNLIMQEAARLGAATVVGEYRSTAKNGMVKEHYAKLGFVRIDPLAEGGDWWSHSVPDFEPTAVPMRICAAHLNAGQSVLEGNAT